MGDGGGPMETIGFSMPELDFFGIFFQRLKAKKSAS